MSPLMVAGIRCAKIAFAGIAVLGICGYSVDHPRRIKRRAAWVVFHILKFLCMAGRAAANIIHRIYFYEYGKEEYEYHVGRK
jgi:hypothetical protein